MSQTVVKLPFSPARPTWPGLWHRIAAVWRDAATRRMLSQLDDRALSDIGISRAQAQFTVERPVWDLTPNSHR